MIHLAKSCFWGIVLGVLCLGFSGNTQAKRVDLLTIKVFAIVSTASAKTLQRDLVDQSIDICKRSRKTFAKGKDCQCHTYVMLEGKALALLGPAAKALRQSLFQRWGKRLKKSNFSYMVHPMEGHNITHPVTFFVKQVSRVEKQRLYAMLASHFPKEYKPDLTSELNQGRKLAAIKAGWMRTARYTGSSSLTLKMDAKDKDGSVSVRIDVGGAKAAGKHKCQAGFRVHKTGKTHICCQDGYKGGTWSNGRGYCWTYGKVAAKASCDAGYTYNKSSDGKQALCCPKGLKADFPASGKRYCWAWGALARK